MVIEIFKCLVLSTRLQPDHCGKRHVAGFDPVCARCSVGKLHRKGERPTTWDDGRAIVRLRIVPGQNPNIKKRRKK